MQIKDEPHIVPYRHPNGFIVQRSKGNVFEYLNQSAGDWASFATVYLTAEIAGKALDKMLKGKFPKFKTNLIAAGSD